MNDIESRVTDLVETSVEQARKTAELFKAEWDARQNLAKTLISLSGATLVFTITFSQSVIKPDTPMSWRYAVTACWLAFICSLVLSLASLWYSMDLLSLPLLMTAESSDLRKAAEEAIRSRTVVPMLAVYKRPFEKTAKQERRALFLLRSALFFYGIALSIFTAIGLCQLLR